MLRKRIAPSPNRLGDTLQEMEAVIDFAALAAEVQKLCPQKEQPKGGPPYPIETIADVVTGQIDMRSWRPGPDDVANDEELAALGDDETDLSEDEPGDGGECSRAQPRAGLG